MSIILVMCAIGVVITLATGTPVYLQMRRNHPRGLMILFFAEMWERFSYYGMRGILIFYLTQHLLFDDGTAGEQYGSYTSLVYLLPLVGGLLADRYLGTRKAILFGAILLVLGHSTMAFEGRPSQQTLVYAGQDYPVAAEGRMDDRKAYLMVSGQKFEFGQTEAGLEIKGLPAAAPLPPVLPAGSFELKKEVDPLGAGAFYLAVSLIIMGVGFLKPNISTIVGQLYPQGDPRRDSGFTLYYYGINLGAFWASILCAMLGQYVGWWAGFGLAGIGMLAGAIVFARGKPLLEGHGEPPDPERLRAPFLGPLSREWVIYIAAILGVGGVWLLVQRNDLVGVGLTLCTVLALGFVLWFLIFKCDRIARERMMLSLVLIFGAVVFFTLFEQAGTSLNLFAARNVDLMGVPAAQTQSFNAGFILLLAPLFAAMWASLALRGRDPNPVMKFGLGLVQVGLGFMVVVWGVQAGLVDDAFRTPLILLVLLYFLHTTGELFLSPVGLSEITKLSVPSIVSFMMAVWFLSSSIAQFVGGRIAALAGTETIGGQVTDPGAALQSSITVFNLLGLWGMGIGVAFIALSFFIKHWAHGVNDPAAHAQPEPIAPVLDGDRAGVSPATVRGEQN